MRSRLILPVLFLLASQAPAQSVIVRRVGERELKRSAYHLGITPEALQTARRALKEATELAAGMEFDDSLQVHRLGGAWTRIHRREAPRNLQTIFSFLKNEARRAEREDAYRQISRAASSILEAMAHLDATRAAELVNEWPAPGGDLGEQARAAYDQFKRNFDSALLRRLAVTDPTQALRRISGQAEGGRTEYSSLALLAYQVARQGRREEARQMVERAITDFKTSELTPDSFQQFANMSQQVFWIFPDLSQDVLLALAARIDEAGDLAGESVEMQMGDQSITLTPAEQSLLRTLSSLQGQPETALSVMSTMPSLSDRIERAGGIDRVLSAQYRRRGDEKGPPARIEDISDLIGKSDRTPELVRNRLEERYGSPEHFDGLIHLAETMFGQDPEFSLQALKVAANVLPGVEPLSEQIPKMSRLLWVCQRSQGVVDQAFLDLGFELVETLRAEEFEDAKLESLEILLMTEWARVDFDNAYSYLQSTDERFRFKTLHSIARSLSRWRR